MTGEQQAAIEIVENDLRMAIQTLSEPYLADVQGIREALECLRKAREGLDTILLQSGTPSAKKEIVNRMIRDIAQEDSQ